MKFSVLLPTRNRLVYLRYAVETVRRQDHPDWEIIVSDNFSEDDIAGYVNGLADPRIKYFRTPRFVPVTDNWNLALEHSDGDYVVMLGDDDGLVPGYFSTFIREFQTFADPDFVYVSAYFFAYPGVMADAPEGLLRRDESKFFGETSPFWLDTARAHQVTRGYLDFKMPIASNMQFSLLSRRIIARMSARSKFFQSPYPDFYATPALFLKADKILIYPRPMVIIGITPKSYGFFHFNNRAAEGLQFLKNDERPFAESSVAARMLPGTSYNDSWLLAMEALFENHSAESGMRPAYWRYRFLQIVHGYKKCFFDRELSPAALAPLRRQMTWYERLFLGTGLQLGFKVLRRVPPAWRLDLIARLRALIGQHSLGGKAGAALRAANLIDVFDWAESTAAACGDERLRASAH